MSSKAVVLFIHLFRNLFIPYRILFLFFALFFTFSFMVIRWYYILLVQIFSLKKGVIILTYDFLLIFTDVLTNSLIL